MKYFLLLLVAVIFIFHPWFSFDKTLSSGDWPYLYAENIREFQIPTQSPFLWLDPYYQITAKIGIQLFHFNWDITEKIFWFIPIIIVNLLSSWLFLKYLFRKLNIHDEWVILLGCFIYIANTYFLMLVGGGQMGVAVAYSLSPLAIYSLIKLIDSKSNLKSLISTIVICSFLMMFDPRIFILSLIIFFTYFLITENKIKYRVKLIEVFFVLVFSLIFNLFWIIPNLSFYKQEFSLIASEPLASFLSFATFPNSLSLLHPNWPENIFGKITFMRPEFILFAILPYLSLIFIDVKKKKEGLIILFFALLSLFGAFMAKGVNPPFGQVYEALSTIPGSTIFRDPTKFYILIAVSYSLLIPFSILKLSQYFDKKIKNFGFLIILSFFIYLFLVLKPAFMGELSGTFKPHYVPQDYLKLKSFILSQNSEFNTLWVPNYERFGFNSQENNAISLSDLFYVTESTSINKLIDNNKSKEKLKNSDIKYIIVPFDSLHEIFINDRKYNDYLYKKTVNGLEKINWLSLLSDKTGKSKFGKIFVFKIKY